MVEFKIDDYAEFHFQCSQFSTGAAYDATGDPAYRVYEANNETAVATGSAAKRDDGNTTGYYYVRFQCTSGAGFEVGKDYFVEVSATVDSVAGAACIGMFRIVPADVAREDQWTDAKAAYLDHSVATVDGNVDTLLTRLSADRAGYLDELAAANLPTDVGGISTAIGALNDLSSAEAQAAAEAGLAAYGAAIAGAEMDLIDAPNETALAAIAAALAGTEMDLVDAPNATAITAIQNGLPSAAANADAVLDEALAGHTSAGTLGALLDEDTSGSLAERIAHLFHRFLTYSVVTEDVDGNGVLVVKDAAGGNVLATIDLTHSGSVTTLEAQ